MQVPFQRGVQPVVANGPRLFDRERATGHPQSLPAVDARRMPLAQAFGQVGRGVCTRTSRPARLFGFAGRFGHRTGRLRGGLVHPGMLAWRVQSHSVVRG